MSAEGRSSAVVHPTSSADEAPEEALETLLLACSGSDFLRTAHNAEEQHYGHTRAPAWLRTFCANDTGCCQDYCTASPGEWRTGFCTMYEPELRYPWLEPFRMAWICIGPCYGIFWDENPLTACIDGDCGECECDEHPFAYITVLLSMIAPPIGYACCGPLIIGGIYVEEGAALAEHPSGAAGALLEGFTCDGSEIPCGIGPACCFFPCAARQMKRHEELCDIGDYERTLRLEQLPARQFLQTRRDACEAAGLRNRHVSIQIFPGSFAPVEDVNEDSPIFFNGVRAVRPVPFWHTVAEVSLLTPSWCPRGVAHWAGFQWLAALTGSADGSADSGCLMTAQLMMEGDESIDSLWLVQHPVQPTTTLQQLYEAAKKAAEERKAKHTSATKLSVMVFCEAGDELELQLIAHEPVAATIKHTLFCALPAIGKPVMRQRHVLVFCGEELDEQACWGDVWKASGMADGCRLDLVSSDLVSSALSGPADAQVWSYNADDTLESVEPMYGPSEDQVYELDQKEHCELQLLTQMGFPPEKAKEALWSNNNDADQALEWLLTQKDVVHDLRESDLRKMNADKKMGVVGFVGMFATRSKAKIAP